MSRRRLVVWLLVYLVSFQGFATGVLIAKGPNHTHVTTRDRVVLEDFRRVGAHATPGETHVLTSIGHLHASGAPARHYHPQGDPAVVFASDGNLVQTDEGTAASGVGSLLLCAAMLPSQITWLDRTGSNSPISHLGWPSLTHDPQPLERPPQAV